MRSLVGLFSLASLAVASPTTRPAAKRDSYAVQTPPLDTPWTYEVGTNPWPEYPRPKLERSNWQNLNGIWRHESASGLSAVDSPPFGSALSQDVLVPSCLESGLSGIQGTNMLYNWYSTSFTVPSDWNGERVLLNFAAVDYEATVFVNGQQAGFHRGGYFAFTLDVTDFVSFDGANELLVFVHDPTDSGDYVIPIGKQTLNPSHIFYRPCSGIWQSVWIESAPTNYITQLDLDGKANGEVNITVHTSGEATAFDISVSKDGNVVGSASGTSGSPFQFTVNSPDVWTPDTPNLYDVTVTLGDDVIQSYTGFRTISRGVVNGIQRPLLNGEFIFAFGTLDQGFWPDGLYTPPNYEAMVYDLHVLKGLGFNMLRKHIKVEPALFYKACDELGLLLIQDMPSLRLATPNADQQAEFGRQLELLINQQKSYTSIYTWVIYNEGWGQLNDGSNPEFGLAEIVRRLDPTRLIDATTGWNDHGAGDYSDNHHYTSPQCGTPFFDGPSSAYDPNRIGIQGEFGGLGLNTTIDHLWNVPQAINAINETYIVYKDLEEWNYNGHLLLAQLADQIDQYACSGGVWTQTTDVEGEVNGLLTYDRRILRTDQAQWRADIQALYDAAHNRTLSLRI